MNKKILCTVVLLSLTTQLIGCKKKNEESVKRIVLESDVRNQKLGEKNNNPKVTVEKINLKLDEGDYFEPAFYHEGEVYGVIDKGAGVITEETSVTHPISGHIKGHLYKVDDDNNLIETSKEAFNFVLESKALNFKLGEENKIFSIDYKNEDKPKEFSQLTDIIKNLRGDSSIKTYYIETIPQDENYVVIYEWRSGTNPRKMYLYDMKNKKLYNRKGEEEGWLYNIFYIESLQSFVHIDRDLKVYKIKFEEKYFCLEEYIDLSKKDKADRIRGVIINDDEVLLFQDKYVSELGYYMHHPLYKTISISKFSFKTNQYDLLFQTPDNVNIYGEYIGNNILALEEFEQKDENVESITPIKRYFEEIRNNSLNVLYKEKIEDEGETMYPHVNATISDDGREIFLTRHLCKLQDGVETTKDAIYKKYTIR